MTPRSIEHPSGLAVDDLPSDAGDDAPLVVMVHGTMDRYTSFARTRSRLMASCRVVCYDRRGYAGSRDAGPKARGMSDHVDDLEQVVAGQRCTLVGHSYGGAVVLSFAERRPELAASVVAYEPPLAWHEWWSNGSSPSHAGRFDGVTSEAAAEAFLRRMIGDHRYERLPLTTRTEALKDGEALVTEMAAIRRDPPPFDPSKISCPVLVVAGSDTSPHHLEGTAWLAGQLSAGSLHVIDGAGHGGHQSHPTELTRLVLAAVALGLDPAAERPPDRL